MSLQESYLKRLSEALNGIELTEKEKSTVTWLSRWDLDTVENIESIFLKLKGQKK